MPFSSSPGFAGADVLTGIAHDDATSLGAVLKPIIAGARARGVADGLELLGLGAVLVDATVSVLHVGGRGRRMMGGWAKVIGNHLVAERSADNRSVQDLIGSVVGVNRHDPEMRIHVKARNGGAGLSVRALRFDSTEGDVQRLHAILVLETV